MSLPVKALVTGAVFAVGSVNAPVDGDWGKLVAGGGAAALVAGLFVWVTRHNSEQVAKRDATFASVVQTAQTAHNESCATFARTVELANQKFADTTNALLRDARAECAAREEKLLDALREARRP